MTVRRARRGEDEATKAKHETVKPHGSQAKPLATFPIRVTLFLSLASTSPADDT